MVEGFRKDKGDGGWGHVGTGYFKTGELWKDTNEKLSRCDLGKEKRWDKVVGQ